MKIISVQDEKDLSEHKPSRVDRAGQQLIGRTLLEMRFEALDRLFSVEGLSQAGFRAKTVKMLESRGEIAFAKAYVKATLGGGTLGDRSPLSHKNVTAFHHVMDKYHEIIETRTVKNETGEPIPIAGKIYQPGDIIRDGEDSPAAQDFARLGFKLFMHQFCRSITKDQTVQDVVSLTDIWNPQAHWNQPRRTDNLRRPGIPQTEQITEG